MRAMLYTSPPGTPQPRERPEDGPPERVLHLSLATRSNGRLQIGQSQALARLGPYRVIEWLELMQREGAEGLVDAMVDAAREFHPTLVWMQVQAPRLITANVLRLLRAGCPSNCMFVEWTGDAVDHDRGTGIAERFPLWLRSICATVDIFTASNAAYPAGALHPHEDVCPAAGFMQCGYDENEFCRRADIADVEGADDIVFTANHYPTMEVESRQVLIAALGEVFPGRLHVYGVGWEPTPGVALHGYVDFESTSYLYSHAQVTISTSCSNRIPRYTSGRLQRVLASGGCCAVQAFDDMEALGLVDGHNCLIWRTTDELIALLRDWLRPERDADREHIRQAAVALASSSMTWNAAMEEMLYMLRRERERRGIPVGA